MFSPIRIPYCLWESNTTIQNPTLPFRVRHYPYFPSIWNSTLSVIPFHWNPHAKSLSFPFIFPHAKFPPFPFSFPHAKSQTAQFPRKPVFVFFFPRTNFVEQAWEYELCVYIFAHKKFPEPIRAHIQTYISESRESTRATTSLLLLLKIKNYENKKYIYVCWKKRFFCQRKPIVGCDGIFFRFSLVHDFVGGAVVVSHLDGQKIEKPIRQKKQFLCLLFFKFPKSSNGQVCGNMLDLERVQLEGQGCGWGDERRFERGEIVRTGPLRKYATAQATFVTLRSRMESFKPFPCSIWLISNVCWRNPPWLQESFHVTSAADRASVEEKGRVEATQARSRDHWRLRV